MPKHGPVHAGSRNPVFLRSPVGKTHDLQRVCTTQMVVDLGFDFVRVSGEGLGLPSSANCSEPSCVHYFRPKIKVCENDHDYTFNRALRDTFWFLFRNFKNAAMQACFCGWHISFTTWCDFSFFRNILKVTVVSEVLFYLEMWCKMAG